MKIILLSIIPITIMYHILKFNRENSANFRSSDLIIQDSLRKYIVFRIDSIHNYYIIYANRNGVSYKIVSQKDILNDCKKIAVNSAYEFDLRSMLFVNGKSIIPANEINEISGWQIDDSTTISFENGSAKNLFLAKNVRGLCVTNN